jgi:hypothetical protein
MIRRLILAALLALLPDLAAAQVALIAPTPATTDNGDRIATTGWVNLWLNSGLSFVSPTGGNKGSGTINISGNYYKNGTIIPETVSSPLVLTAGNVTCPNCVLISGTAHGNTDYSILSTDRYVYTSAAFTAPRTWTLPAANSLPVGTTIWVQDAQGTVTTTNTLTISRAGADTIDVGNTTLVITGAGGGITFTTDGVSNWGTPIQTVSTGGTGQKTLTSHGVLIGAGANPITQSVVGSNGQLFLGSTGADPAWLTMSQDCTITNGGVISCTKTNNVSFGPLATQAIPCTVAQGCTGDTGTAWQSYTPTIACQTGTLTSSTATGAFKTIGKTVFVEINIAITTNGTCAVYLTASLPTGTLATNVALAGGTGSNFGIVSYGTTGGTTVFILKYDGTYPGNSGSFITLSGVYQST